MEQKYFLYKLLPPRPAFHLDQTPEENAVMKQHSVYWSGLKQQGAVLAYGPVFDPKGVWGVAIFMAADEQDAKAIIEKDPAIVTGLGNYEVMGMMLGK